jgi:hypothetical protein
MRCPLPRWNQALTSAALKSAAFFLGVGVSYSPDLCPAGLTNEAADIAAMARRLHDFNPWQRFWTSAIILPAA